MVRHDAVEIFFAAVSSVQPAQLLAKHLLVQDDSLLIGGTSIPKTEINNIYVIGAGKAVAAMAVETEKILGRYITDGLVVTKYHHSLPCKKIIVIEAAHPVPDENGIAAVEKTKQLLQKVGKNDIVICLISGGASALWCDLPEGISLQDMQVISNALLKSGASIEEMNAVRKHFSTIKGGQLINHCNGARVFSFMISDVPGDKPEVIASGPTVADPSSFEDAKKVFEKYNLSSILPKAILTYMDKGISGTIAETPKPGDPIFNNTFNKIIGTNTIALNAAAQKATTMGYHVHAITNIVTGDTEEEAKKLVEFAMQFDGPFPACIIQGGETTIKVTGTGKGGRNQHFVLSALKEIKNSKSSANISILSGGTDGSDGPTDATGAIADRDTLVKAEQSNLPIDKYLENNDAYNFFNKTDGLLITGPTQTNVMDIMIAIID